MSSDKSYFEYFKDNNMSLTLDKSLTRDLSHDALMKMEKEHIQNMGLGMTPELMGFSGLNPYGMHNSASRGYMFISQLSAVLALAKPDIPITLSGLESEMNKSLLSIKTNSNIKIIDFVRRYDYSGKHGSVYSDVEVSIIYIDLDKNEINYIPIPKFEKYHTYFGFQHTPTKTLERLKVGDILPPDVKLTTTNSDIDGLYGYGKSMYVYLSNIHEIGEDAVVVCEDVRDDFEFKIYEERKFSYGNGIIPLNIYGDEENYKFMPDIGEYIHDNNMLVALRTIDDSTFASLFSNKDLMEENPTFDECIYVRGPGGKVSDITVIYTPPNKKTSVYSKVDTQGQKYADALSNYRETIDKTVSNTRSEYGDDLLVGNELHSEIVSGRMLESPNAINTFKQETLNTYTITITIEYTVPLSIGHKVTGNNGDKGIVSHFLPRSEMPVDEHGNSADMIMGALSTVDRNNTGRSYEGYMGYASRLVKQHIQRQVDGRYLTDISKGEIDEMFDIVLRFLSHVDGKQYLLYSDPNTDRVEILQEIIDKELYILYPVDNERKTKEIVESLQNSEFKQIAKPIEMTLGGKRVMSKEPLNLTVMSIMLLSKIADTGMVCNTPRLNHFGDPVSSSKSAKHKTPYRNNAVRALGESDYRLAAANVPPRALAEIRDRTDSFPSQVALYDGILDADNPANIDTVIDRSKHKFGEGTTMKLVNSMLNSAGVELKADIKEDE